MAEFKNTAKSESDGTYEQRELVINNTHEKLGTIFFSERVLQAEDMVSVYGAGTLEPDPEGAKSTQGYRGAPPTRLRMHGSASNQIRIASDNRSLKAAPSKTK